uniref:glutathione transferase n=1 Tax=Ciona intestinalis TaxID=7719 RepID=F6VQ32_CIOIN
MVVYKLYYFPHMGREEIVRLMFAHANIEYEDIRIPYEEWPSKKSTMPFSQLPVFKIDGDIICQSGAILRYAAQKCGLAGCNDLEVAKADMITECFFDIMLRFPWLETDEAKKAESMRKCLYESVPPSLKQIEAMLVKNGGDYFVSQLTHADFALLNAGQYLLEHREDIFKDTPILFKHFKKIESLPSIAQWLKVRPGQ